MASDIYNDPEVEVRWIVEQRAHVLEYLEGQRADHGGVPEEPDWFVAPYLALWRVFSGKVPRAIGWWAISGDVPTDYISSRGVPDARAAMIEFAKNWRQLSQYMLRGEPHPTTHIGTPDQWPELGDLLASRAMLLAEFAKDDSNWV